MSGIWAISVLLPNGKALRGEGATKRDAEIDLKAKIQSEAADRAQAKNDYLADAANFVYAATSAIGQL